MRTWNREFGSATILAAIAISKDGQGEIFDAIEEQEGYLKATGKSERWYRQNIELP